MLVGVVCLSAAVLVRCVIIKLHSDQGMQFPRCLVRRWLKTHVADLRRGDYIYHNHRLHTVDTVSSIQKGRGCRSFLLQVKEMVPAGPDAPVATSVSLKPSSREEFEVVAVKEQAMVFMYFGAGGEAVCMDGDGLEEVVVARELMTAGLKLLLEAGERVRVRYALSLFTRRFIDGEDAMQVVAIVPQNAVKCTVKEILAQGSSVVAVTVGGARIACSSIVAVGDRINVDPATGQYLSRV